MTATQAQVLTYHDIAKTHFLAAKERIDLAAENFNLAQERKRAALDDDSHKDIEKQAQVQANLNEEREKLLNRMEVLKKDIRNPDNTPIPTFQKFIIFSHDGVKLEFAWHHKDEEGVCEIETTIANIFHKCGRAQIQSMKKGSKRTYIERGIDFILSFHSDTLFRYLTMQEFYDMRAMCIGKKCISHIHGIARKDPISAVEWDEGQLKLTVGEVEHKIGEPVTVSADEKGIWAFDPNAGSFTWIWYNKE